MLKPDGGLSANPQMYPMLSHLRHNPCRRFFLTNPCEFLFQMGVYNAQGILGCFLAIFGAGFCSFRMFVGFPESFVEPFSPISGLCGATVYCAEGAKPTCLVYQPRKSAEESSFLSVSYILLFRGVVCCCFGTSSVVVLGRFGVSAEPRAPTQETCRGQTVFPSFPVFFECRLSLFWGLGCHSFGVLSVVVLGSCLLFWGGICRCCF